MQERALRSSVESRGHAAKSSTSSRQNFPEFEEAIEESERTTVSVVIAPSITSEYFLQGSNLHGEVSRVRISPECNMVGQVEQMHWFSRGY